jgi:hypothetical protein
MRFVGEFEDRRRERIGQFVLHAAADRTECHVLLLPLPISIIAAS